jgi:hypothetical protein
MIISGYRYSSRYMTWWYRPLYIYINILNVLDQGGEDGILELVEEVEEVADMVEDETCGQEEVLEKLKVSCTL